MSTIPRYVARAEPNLGWRIWNRATKRPWGNCFESYPEDVLRELNGEARQSVLTRLSRGSRSKGQIERKHR